MLSIQDNTFTTNTLGLRLLKYDFHSIYLAQGCFILVLHHKG